MRLTWHGATEVIQTALLFTSREMQIMPKIAHQNLSIRILSRAFSLNETRYVRSLYTGRAVGLLNL
jgi:hypothetical protein